jgi:DMSO reductase anchor subunit
MHPAPSIVVFTVLSGLGLGMMIWAGLGFGPDSPWILGLAVLGITGVGGFASVGHLARPDRAWRAFSQWRSSWLSREACLMLAAMATFGLYILTWLMDTHLPILGWISAVLALGTVYATAMIYAQLRTVPRWSATPTPLLFVVLSLAGGLCGICALGGTPSWLALLALILAGGVAFWWQKIAFETRRDFNGSTLSSATGLAGRVRMLEPPHTGSNYLLKEMAFSIGRKRAFQLRWLGFFLGFILPAVLALLSLGLGSWALGFALVLHILGMLALRWLFFAEAEHVQALYYGQDS